MKAVGFVFAAFDILAFLLNSVVILIYFTYQGELKVYRHFIAGVAILDLLCALFTFVMQPIFVSKGKFSFMLTTGPLSSNENSHFLIVGYALVYYCMILMLMNSFVCRYVVLHQNRLSFFLRKRRLIFIILIFEFIFCVNIAIGLDFYFGHPNFSPEVIKASNIYLEIPYTYAYLALDMEPSLAHLGGWLYLLQCNAIIIGAALLSGYCTFAISKSTGYGRISADTRKMHRKLLYSLIIQLSLTLGFLAFPMISALLLAFLGYGIDRQMAYWLSSTLPLAPCVNPIIVFIFIADYRNQLFKFVLCKRAKKHIAVTCVETTGK